MAAPRVEASDFEKEYHQMNLSLIIERKLFTPSSSIAYEQ